MSFYRMLLILTHLQTFEDIFKSHVVGSDTFRDSCWDVFKSYVGADTFRLSFGMRLDCMLLILMYLGTMMSECV